MKKIDRCINCKELPIIVKSDLPEWKFLLTHKEKYGCSAGFKLDTYQNTKLQCINSWNEFNIENDTSRKR